jgi:hypothetical protein
MKVYSYLFHFYNKYVFVQCCGAGAASNRIILIAGAGAGIASKFINFLIEVGSGAASPILIGAVGASK